MLRGMIEGSCADVISEIWGNCSPDANELLPDLILWSDDVDVCLDLGFQFCGGASIFGMTGAEASEGGEAEGGGGVAKGSMASHFMITAFAEGQSTPATTAKMSVKNAIGRVNN